MKLKTDIVAGMKAASCQARKFSYDKDANREEQKYWEGVRDALAWVQKNRDEGLGDFEEFIHYVDAATEAAIASELAKYKL